MKLLIALLINAVALLTTAYVLPGVDFEGGLFELLVVTVVFSLVNTFIRPVVRFLTLPLTVITFGLFTLVVNGFMVIITTWLVDAFSLEGGLVRRSLTAIAAALVISVISVALGWVVFRDRDERATR